MANETPDAPAPSDAALARARREGWNAAIEKCAEVASGYSPGIVAEHLRALRMINDTPAPAAPADDLGRCVSQFAAAMLAKAREAEAKYGYTDEWKRGDWIDHLRAAIRHHVEKGDPRDVAVYCAFAHWHGWSLAPAQSPAPAVPVPDEGTKKRRETSSYADLILRLRQPALFVEPAEGQRCKLAMLEAADALEASDTSSPPVPAEVREALSEEDYASIIEEAAASLRQAAKGVQGQVVRPADSLEWHVMQVTRKRMLARLDAAAGGEGDHD